MNKKVTPKLHYEKDSYTGYYTSYRNVRKNCVIIKVLEQNMMDSGEYKLSIGAIEKESKNGWLKLRVRGELKTDCIRLCFLK